MKTIEFEVPNADGTPARYILVPATARVAARADHVYRRAVARAVRSGRPTPEQTAVLAAAEWEGAKRARHDDIKRAIAADEVIVANTRVELDERRYAAYRLRRLREEARALKAGVNAIEAAGAASAGLTEMFDYTAGACTRFPDGRRVFPTTAEFTAARERGDEVATRACWVLAGATLGLREDHEASLPENTFLAAHQLAC